MTLVCDAVRAAPRKVRVSRVLAPIGPGQDLELAIRREARRALTELRRLVNDIAWPEVMTAKAALKASQPRTIMDAGLSGMFRAAWRKVVDALWYVAERTIAKALSIEEVRHRTKFIRSLNAAIGIDLGAVLREGDLAHQMELAMQRSVGLIRGLSDETAAALEKALIQLLTEGASNERIAKTIAERFGFAERRARFIARDQAATFNSELNRIRLQQIGVTEYVWSTALDERVRGNPVGKYPSARPSHWEREGKLFKWSDPPEGGHPGMAINCFPGSTEVKVFDEAVKGFRRWYDGELATVITDANERIAATPNHPVLTQRGWVPIGLLNCSDYLVKVPEHCGGTSENDDQRVKTIEDHFRSLSELSVRETHHLRPTDFHGDGADCQVDIVFAARRLGVGREAQAQEPLSDLGFPMSDEARAFRCALAHLGVSGTSSANSVVSGGGQLATSVETSFGHALKHGVASVSDGCAAFNQTTPNDDAANARSLRESQFAFPANIPANNLSDIEVGAPIVSRAAADRNIEARCAETLADGVSIKADGLGRIGESDPGGYQFARVAELIFSRYAGHVYNLETASSAYLASGFIVHNCRCVARAVIGDPRPMQEQSKARQAAALRRMAAAKAARK